MSRDKVRTDIDRIIKDKTLSQERQVEMLRKMYDEVRAEQRAQTESAMVDDQDIGAELRDIEMALESLGTEASKPEEGGAATL